MALRAERVDNSEQREIQHVVRNPKDRSPEKPGGRAAERLRQFEKARRPSDQKTQQDRSGRPAEGTPQEGVDRKGGSKNEKPGREDD